VVGHEGAGCGGGCVVVVGEVREQRWWVMEQGGQRWARGSSSSRVRERAWVWVEWPGVERTWSLKCEEGCGMVVEGEGTCLGVVMVVVGGGGRDSHRGGHGRWGAREVGWWGVVVVVKEQGAGWSWSLAVVGTGTGWS
jgi:hypothetical protein